MWLVAVQSSPVYIIVSRAGEAPSQQSIGMLKQKSASRNDSPADKSKATVNGQGPGTLSDGPVETSMEAWHRPAGTSVNR